MDPQYGAIAIVLCICRIFVLFCPGYCIYLTSY